MVSLLECEGVFECGYGIRRIHESSHPKLSLSVVPLVFARLVQRISRLPFLKDYYGYLVGEYLTGLFFKNKIARDDSNIVFVKPRPFSLVSECKEKGKLVVLEFGEMHPYETRDRLLKEYEKYDVGSQYIFTSSYAIKESVKSIDLADLIVVLSEESKRSFVNHGVPECKIRVVNLGLSKLSSTRFDDRKEFAFVSTAKHSFVKGTHNLLLAWKKANINSMNLYIVGELSEDIKKFVERYGPFDNVVFCGAKDIQTFYAQYNFIGILNSLAEGYGRAVIEYMGHGFPVITTRVATCDIVEHRKNGFVVESEEELVGALTYFSENRALYQDYGIRAKASAELTIDKVYANQMLELFRGL